MIRSAGALLCWAAAVLALPVARQARASPRGVAMGTEAGAGHVRVGAVHSRLLTMHHDELRRSRAHAAAVARKQIAVAALLTLAARPALNGGDCDGHVMLGLQVAGRAQSERLAADGVEKRRRRRGGGRGVTRIARSRADVRAAGLRRGAGSAKFVV